MSDLAAWRELIGCAGRAASDPHYCRPLGAAAKRANRSVFPDQAQRQVFHELLGLSTLWPQLPLSKRREKAGKLANLARRCAVIMGDEPPHDPEPAEVALPSWRRRADIGD